MPPTELSKSGTLQIPAGPRRSGWVRRLLTWLRTLTQAAGCVALDGAAPPREAGA